MRGKKSIVPGPSVGVSVGVIVTVGSIVAVGVAVSDRVAVAVGVGGSGVLVAVSVGVTVGVGRVYSTHRRGVTAIWRQSEDQNRYSRPTALPSISSP